LIYKLAFRQQRAFEDNFDDNDEITLTEPIYQAPQGPVVNVKIDNLEYQQGQVMPTMSDEVYLTRLANVLTQNQELFEQVNVKGYAGDFKATKKLGNTNRIISHSRAKDVLKRLATNGLPNSKIYSRAYGELNPNSLSTEDRKVELEFTGVKDENQLRALIMEINKL